MSKLLDLSDYESQIAEAAQAIKAGKLVVFPTETVYGIGANGLDTIAVEGIFKAKMRPADNPLILHISGISQLEELVAQITPQATKLAERFWPGPLTMVLQKANIVPDIVTGGLDSVAVRMPNSKIALDLITRSGVPIAAPSANLSGSPSPTRVEHVIADLNGRVDYIIDGGASDVGLESTVVLLTGEKPTLLRPGGITLEELTAVVGDIEVSSAVLSKLDEQAEVLSPGMKYKHYAPKAEVVLVNGDSEAFISFCNSQTGNDILILCFREELDRIEPKAIAYGGQTGSREQAYNLFDTLRKADILEKKLVYVHAPSTEGVGLAVYNRLLRAAAFKQIEL